MRRLRRLAVNLALACGAVLLVCLALEGVLAVVKINSRAVTVYDRDTGVSFVPGAYYINRKEGFSEGHFNSHGFRDFERTAEKPPNTYRILVLGDSFVEALQVPLERAFPALLEAKLNAATHSQRFEVLAMGRSGDGTADADMRYLNGGVHFSPDMVILAFYMGNDVSDNSRFLSRDWIRFYFSIDQHGQLVLDRSVLDRYLQHLSPLQRAYQAAKQHSYLLSLISERAFLLRRELYARRFAQAHASQHTGGGFDEFSEFNVFLPDPTPHWTEAWTITEKTLVKLSREVGAHSASFLLVTLGTAEQVHPELEGALREQYGLPFDFDFPDRRLQAFAAQDHIPSLDLVPLFRAYHQRTGVWLHGIGSAKTGHWNEAGHRLAAEEIFSFLWDHHLVPQEELR